MGQQSTFHLEGTLYKESESEIISESIREDERLVLHGH